MVNSPKQMSKVGILFLSLLIGCLLLAVIGNALPTLLGLRINGTPFAKALVAIVMLASLAVGIGLIRRRGRGTSQTNTTGLDDQPSVDPDRLARLTGAARNNNIVAMVEPEPEPELVAVPEVESAGSGEAIGLARYHPIVFRQSFPPADDHGLSYYGGLPTGPADIVWPRHAFDGGEAPLSFVMQWDCRELAAQDATGLLPRDGVLYFFASLEWANPKAFRFVHAPGDVADWEPLKPPADLPPVLGDQTAWQVPWCNPHIEAEHQHCPTLLPKWPFRPLALEYPATTTDDDDEEAAFWSERAMAEVLLKAQDSLGAPPTYLDPDGSYGAAVFDGFPHDWAAVRIVCSKVIDTLRKPIYTRLPRSIEELEGEAREARIAEWSDEARELYRFAASHAPDDAVPGDLSVQIRVWMDKVNGCFMYGLVVKEAVNVSLGLHSKALAAIPPDLIAKASLDHALGIAYDRKEYRHEFNARCCAGLDQEASDRLWNAAKEAGTLPIIHQVSARVPNRIFGPASFVQGDVAELVEDHVLLLEIGSSSQIGIELGEGVIQYMIRPDDLRQGRFDKAQVILSAY